MLTADEYALQISYIAELPISITDLLKVYHILPLQGASAKRFPADNALFSSSRLCSVGAAKMSKL